VKVQFTCQACGYRSARWLGRCPNCGEWNSFVEEAELPHRVRDPKPARPTPLVEVSPLPEERWPTGIGELDRVLGGGFVPGSLVLVGGDPGIGKSTLALQAAFRLAKSGRPVLYVAGEESAQQTRMRAERLGALSRGVWVVAETDLDAVLASVRQLRPALVVVDSIQTVYRPDVPSAPGSVGQVRECAATLLQLAKSEGPAVLLVGHVTKEGMLAGPRVLEHLVDTVLYFEGERHQAYRILRATKNRFGSTNEIGVFEMGPSGLVEVPNPSLVFLSERPRGAAGAAVVCTVEGSRPLLVEVQALVSPTPFGTPRRAASGVDSNRLLLLLAVLEKHAGFSFSQADVYANAAGGVRVEEPAADLGICLALVSSYRSVALDDRTVFCGELGLAGEVRPVPQLARRLGEASKLGFQRALIPRGGKETEGFGLELVPVGTVGEALELAPWR